jgi:glycosyltransferase involved in cell wall biosynthesis
VPEVDVAEVAIVLATYNEAANLAPLVEALEQLGEDLHLLVVDDNSPDGTQRVARELAAAFGNITVIGRPGKLGLGSALREGLKAALATGAQYVMTMDADHSHDPGDVPRLLEAMRDGEADMVQGSRYVPGGDIRGWGWQRRVLSRVANLLYHWVAGAPHESTTNFRVFSRRAAEAVLARARGRDFEFQPEAALLVLAAGFKVREVPIVFSNRVRGSSKLGKKQAIKALVFFVTATLQYRLRVGRFARPSREGPGPARRRANGGS